MFISPVEWSPKDLLTTDQPLKDDSNASLLTHQASLESNVSNYAPHLLQRRVEAGMNTPWCSVQ